MSDDFVVGCMLGIAIGIWLTVYYYEYVPEDEDDER